MQISWQRVVISFIFSVSSILFFALLSSTALISSTSAQSPAGKSGANEQLLPLDPPAMDVLSQLNEWRLSAGLWPLVLNDTLTQMAQDHADYLIGLSELPKGGDIHHDAQGRTPPERAFQSYDWPAYGDNALWVAAGEVAYVGATARRAIEYWQGSDIHNRTVTNSAYREVGVGIVPHPYGYLYIVVLGAQPDVLPVAVDPLSDQLFFTQETYRYAKGQTTLAEVTQFQLVLDESKVSRDNWQAWTAITAWDEQLGTRLAIYSDGRNQITYSFNPLQNIVWTLPLVEAVQEGRFELATPPAPAIAETPQATTTETPVVIAQAETPQASISPTGDMPTAFPTNTPPSANMPTAFPTNTAIPSLTPTQPVGDPQVLILYDARSFTMINLTTESLNLGQLVFEGANGRLVATRWDTQFATASITALPAGGCVRLWSINESSNPPLPSQCNYARSVLTLSSGLFWTADFTVSGANGLLANCPVAAGRCELFLP